MKAPRGVVEQLEEAPSLVAALVMLPLIVHEGVETCRAESCADDETEAA